MLEKKNDSSLSIKQLRSALGLKKTATAKLKAELQKLIKDRKIKKQGTRYFAERDSKKKTFTKEKKSGNIRTKFTGIW